MRKTTLGFLAILALSYVAACESTSDGETGAGGTGGVSTGGSAPAGATSGGDSAGGVAGTTPPAGGSSSGGAGASSGGAGATGGGGNGGSALAGSAGTSGAIGGSASGSSGAAGASGAMADGGGGSGIGGSAGSGNDAGNAGAGSGNAAGNAGAGGAPTRPARVLLYSFSTLDIASVPAQLAFLEQRLESWDYEVVQSEDPAIFTDSNLATYAAVGMINTCFYPFGANNTTGEPQSQVLQRFLQQGGGLFGTHCADVTFQSANPPALYNQLIGGRASSQNFTGTSDCRKVGDHPTIAELPATFSYTGNLDGTNFIATDTTILVNCRWEDGTDVAVSWFRNEGSGRVFFTNFAKEDNDLKDSTLGEQHILPGLEWVLGR